MFCQIVAGQRDVGVIAYEDDDVVVFASRHQRVTNEGHMLLVTRRHFRNLYDLPAELDTAVLGGVRRTARAVERAFRASGTTIRQNNDPPGQDVFHVHFHVIPRHVDDANLAAPYRVLGLTSRMEQARTLAAAIERLDGGLA